MGFESNDPPLVDDIVERLQLNHAQLKADQAMVPELKSKVEALAQKDASHDQA